MEPSADLPPCDWDATRAIYLERFGPLFTGDFTSEEGGPPFAVLCFWDPDRPGSPAVYASFGAPAGEIFLAVVAPGLGVGAMLERAARGATRDLDPPALLEAEARCTPFRGVVVLPDEDGFAVRAADGSTRWVRRAVALTRPEILRAQIRSAEAVLPAIRAAGGDVADVLRVCTVQPAHTQSFRESCAPANVRRLRQWLADVDGQIAALRARSASTEAAERNAAAFRAALSHYETALPPVPTDTDRAAGLAAASEAERYQITIDAAIESGIDHVTPDLYWDPFALSGFRILLCLALTTHPGARPLLVAAAGSEDLPAPASLSPDEHRRKLLALLADAADALTPGSSRSTREALLARGIEALEAPRDRDDPDYAPVLTASSGWPIAIGAMLCEVYPTATQDDRAMIGAYKMALAMCGQLEEELEGETPFERLVAVCRRLAFYMMMGYAMVHSRSEGPVN